MAPRNAKGRFANMKIDELTIGEARALVEQFGKTGKASKPKLEQKRVILVVDRGWIFAGDQSLTSDGLIRLTNAVHVFRWDSIGFPKMVENWRDPTVDIRKVADVEVPRDSVIFRVPVPDGWGVK
jgi:hypothetical protein